MAGLVSSAERVSMMTWTSHRKEAEMYIGGGVLVLILIILLIIVLL